MSNNNYSSTYMYSVDNNGGKDYQDGLLGKLRPLAYMVAGKHGHWTETHLGISDLSESAY